MDPEIKKFNKFQNTLLLLVIIVALVFLLSFLVLAGDDIPLELMLFFAVVVYSEYLLIKKSYLYSVFFTNLGAIVFLIFIILSPIKCSGSFGCFEAVKLLAIVPLTITPFLIGLLADLRINSSK